MAGLDELHIPGLYEATEIIQKRLDYLRTHEQAIKRDMGHPSTFSIVEIELIRLKAEIGAAMVSCVQSRSDPQSTSEA